MKYIAAVLVVAVMVVGIVATVFIKYGFSVKVESDVKVEIGVDHEPAPELHYHIKKEGTWAL